MLLLEGREEMGRVVSATVRKKGWAGRPSVLARFSLFSFSFF
jgi:hypothetical protein